MATLIDRKTRPRRSMDRITIKRTLAWALRQAVRAMKWPPGWKFEAEMVAPSTVRVRATGGTGVVRYTYRIRVSQQVKS